MTIISLFLNEKMLEELDIIRNKMGFIGRSEAVRAGIRMLFIDMKEKEELTGNIVAILLLIHGQDAEDFVTKAKHYFSDIIHTQIHNRFKPGKCMELFILNGDANRIKEFTKIFQKNGKIDYTKLTLT